MPAARQLGEMEPEREDARRHLVPLIDRYLLVPAWVRGRVAVVAVIEGGCDQRLEFVMMELLDDAGKNPSIWKRTSAVPCSMFSFTCMSEARTATASAIMATKRALIPSALSMRLELLPCRRVRG